MSDIIDINVNETIEEVTINVTDNLITVNINKITGGGGGTQTLAQTLDLGNTTGGENISISNGDAIILDNGSMLKKGTIDAGNGGSKGISQICSVGYEHKWEAGRLYIMNDGGTTIREVSHNFTTIPTENDDDTKGFVTGSRWILDNGTTYICTDPTEGAAVWEIYHNFIPTLDQVLTENNESTKDAKIGKLFLYDSIKDFFGAIQISNGIFSVGDTTTGNTLFSVQLGIFKIFNTLFNSAFLNFESLTANRTFTFQNKSGTLATLDDIPTTTSQLTNNGADGVNPFITALDIPTAGTASTIVREVKNMTGATLTKGTVVYISGANGNKPLVSKALATTDALSSRTFGLLQSNISNNGLGNCVIIGDLSGLDTSSFSEGDQLYLSGVTAGTYTATKILAPTHLVYVGKVTRSHPTQGQIEVGIQNGYELSEIHDVALSSEANNQALVYESSTDLWKNKTIDKTFVGLGNVDNTSDANKPVSTAQQTAIDAKVADAITDGVTTIAPSQNAVFDALGGLTSRINQNFIVSIPFSGLSPNDNTTYYIGPSSGIIATTEANRRWKFPYETTIRTLSIALGQTTAGTSEAVSVYLRNSTAGTETLVGTFTSNFTAATGAFFNFSGLNISIPNTTDNWTLKIVTPTWVTNPTAWTGSFFLIAN
jgi:hypothetical protein